MKEEVEYRPGATIIRQGEEDSGFYVLEKGAVEVFKDGLLLNILMYPGTIFGEMGEILEKPRTCTVKARTHCVLTRWEGANLEELVHQEPDFALKLIKTLAGRLDRTTQKLADLFREAVPHEEVK